MPLGNVATYWVCVCPPMMTGTPYEPVGDVHQWALGQIGHRHGAQVGALVPNGDNGVQLALAA